ncbi:flagellar motor switch protein FliN [bacterium]|nr:flagellar motor switch protein FliN [bacterium]
MTPESLSQEEINALLKGGLGGEAEVKLEAEERRALLEFARRQGEAFSRALTEQLGVETTIELGEIVACDAETAGSHVPKRLVAAVAEYTQGLSGRLTSYFAEDEAGVLCGRLTGAEELGPAQQTALAGLMNQTLERANEALSQATSMAIAAGPPSVSLVKSGTPEFKMSLPSTSERLALIGYAYFADEKLQGTFYQAVPGTMIELLVAARPAAAAAAKPMEAPKTPTAPPREGPRARPVVFDELTATPPVDTTNLELILDIGLSIRVELGRTSMKVRDILELGPGSVVELDKLAGEPVELLVNDKLFAKGEVVVIDENFGVRITDILSIRDRIESLR